MKRARVLVGSVLLLASALAGCSGKATPAECAQMLDKYLDMVIASDPALADLSPEQARAAREMKKALRKGEPSYRRVAEQCESSVTKREHRCAVKAPSPETWQACID
jgi:hypothetical protein